MPRIPNSPHNTRIHRLFLLFAVALSVLSVVAVGGIAFFDGVSGAPAPQRRGPAVAAPSVVSPSTKAVVTWGVQDAQGRFVSRGLTQQGSDYAKIDLVVTERDGDRRVVSLARK